MKKILCIILVMACLFSSAFAEYDFSKMSDSDLKELISSAEAELKKRFSETDENVILYDKNDIKVYLTRKYKIRDTYGGNKVIDFECILENNTSRSVELYAPESSMNGWDLGTSSFYGDASFTLSANPGKKAKGVICLSMTNASVTSYSQIETADFVLGIYFDGISYYSNPPDLSEHVYLEFVNGVITLI